MALEKKYWKGFADLTDAPEMDKLRQNEFAEELPTAEFLGNEQLNEGSTSRRDFLKYLGFRRRRLLGDRQQRQLRVDTILFRNLLGLADGDQADGQ